MTFKAMLQGPLMADFSGAEGPPPAGKGYTLEIEEMAPHVSRKGNPTAVIVFKVIAAPSTSESGVGARVQEYFPLTGNGVHRLAAVMKAIGIEVPTGEAELDPSNFVGKQLTADIEHEEFAGVMRARITLPRPLLPRLD